MDSTRKDRPGAMATRIYVGPVLYYREVNNVGSTRAQTQHQPMPYRAASKGSPWCHATNLCPTAMLSSLSSPTVTGRRNRCKGGRRNGRRRSRRNRRNDCESYSVAGFPWGHCTLLSSVVHDQYCVSITCLLYTSPSPRDLSTSRMPSSA